VVKEGREELDVLQKQGAMEGIDEKVVGLFVLIAVDSTAVDLHRWPHVE